MGAKPNSATLEYMKSKGVENIFIDAYDEKTEKLSRFFPQFCDILQNCETKVLRLLIFKAPIFNSKIAKIIDRN